MTGGRHDFLQLTALIASRHAGGQRRQLDKCIEQ